MAQFPVLLLAYHSLMCYIKRVETTAHKGVDLVS